MTEFSFFETTAEVSVTFAGFISIFLVLATRDGRFAPADSLEIRGIVLSSIASVFYSAVPLVLYSLGVSGDTLWRISSGAIGLFAAAVVSTTLVPDLLALSVRALTGPLACCSELSRSFAALRTHWGGRGRPLGGCIS